MFLLYNSHGRENAFRMRFSARAGTALCMVSFVFLCTSAFALDPDRALTQYIQDVWTTDNGLPQNSVFGITQTHDGYIWMGTMEGLVRFDGARFTVFNKQNTPAIKENWVMRVQEDQEHNLWIGTRGGGVTRLKDRNFTNFVTQLPDPFIVALCNDHSGGVWIGTTSGLSHFQNEKFTNYTGKDGLTNDHIYSLYLDSADTLWIGTRAGLNFFKNGKFGAITTEDGLPHNTVYTVAKDDGTGLWIGTKGGGLTHYQDGKLTAYAIGVDVWSIVQDRKKNVWLGTNGGGIKRFSDGKIAQYSLAEGLPSDSGYPLLEDREGSLWIGTNGGGLARLRDGKVKVYSTKEGLSNDMATSVYQDHEGAIWIGTVGSGLNCFRDGKFTLYTTRDGLSDDTISSFAEDKDGTLFIGTNLGVNRFKENKFSAITKKDGLLDDTVYALQPARDGGLWIGTGNGLNHLQDGKLTSYTQKDGLSGRFVYVIFETPDGAVWIGTDNGVDRLKDGKITAYTTGQGLSNDEIFSLHGDDQGNLWIGTNGGGLNRFKNGRFQSVTVEQGLFDNRVYQILEDSDHNFWMSSNRGIFRVSIRELNDAADGRIPAVTSVSFGKSDGMRNQECNGGSFPAGWKTREGKLWFPTIAGVVVIDTRHIPRNDIVPPVHVEEMLADKQPIDSTTLPAGKEKFEFHYTALSFLVPERVRFRYKLEGFDRDWTDAGTQRAAYYTHLPHGDYTFRVQACNDDGVWNEAGASLSFQLMPHFYQTPWFYGLCLIGAVALTAGAYRARVAHLKAREKTLLIAVEEKTQDLREANEKLRVAQDKIVRLQESAPMALDNLSAWCKTAAADIARAINASEIAVWTVQEEGLKRLSGTQTKPPSLEDLRAARPFTNTVVSEGQLMMPIVGLSGSLYGALMISGSDTQWGETEMRLVAGFAHQLGGTLETQDMARRLLQAEERKAMKLQEMKDRGIRTLVVCPACQTCYNDTVERCERDRHQLYAPRTLPYRIQDRYRLCRMLGSGGMGSVFQAQDEKLNRSIAIKIIRAELLNDPSMRMRLEREAHMVARIQHIGVVSIHDFGELPDGSAFLVMELLEGSDVSRILKDQGPGTPLQVAEVLSQVGAALTAAHEEGVIHRDLKPANLFLIPAGVSFQVKVLDFGLAKPLGEQTGLTQSGMMIGTPGYMSPEQIREQTIGVRSDLFSLAAMAYELLTGIRPFEADTVFDILHKVLLEEPARISSFLKEAPPEVDRAFAEALHKDAGSRPQTVAIWVRQIVPLLQSMPSYFPGWVLEDTVAPSAESGAREGSSSPHPVV